VRDHVFVALLALCPLGAATAQVGFGVTTPGLSIGINVPTYPELVPVPGYPVYYAPQLDANYFFYDGLYWQYYGDSWYASTWYNGPWRVVVADAVPLYVLRVPVRYYRRPPVYFRGWRADLPPRWGDRWGPVWVQHHEGWDHWNSRVVPARAPLPVYQRQYFGSRYPRAEQQVTLASQHYRYQPREVVTREHYLAPSQSFQSGATAPNGQRALPQDHRQTARSPEFAEGQGPGRGNETRMQRAPSPPVQNAAPSMQHAGPPIRNAAPPMQNAPSAQRQQVTPPTQTVHRGGEPPHQDKEHEQKHEHNR
jgi:hypothetical protein